MMNIVNVFLILAISVVSIDLSFQFQNLNFLREIEKNEDEYRQFENNLRNRNEENRRESGHVYGYDDPDTRTFIGIFSGPEEGIAEAMAHAYNHFNVSRVFLETSDRRLFEGRFNDRRAPFHVEPLGPNPQPDNIDRKEITLDHDPSNGFYPFYSQRNLAKFQLYRPERVILEAPDKSQYHYNIIWPEGEESSLSRTPSIPPSQGKRERKNVKNEETQKQMKGRKTSSSKSGKGEMIPGFNYNRMFGSTSKPGSSARSSSGQTGAREGKGKNKAKEEEEEEEENKKKDPKGKKTGGGAS